MARRPPKAGRFRYDTRLDPNTKLIGAVRVPLGRRRSDASVPLPPGADFRRFEEDLFTLIRRTFDKTFGDRIAKRIPKLYARSPRIRHVERADDEFSVLASAPAGGEAEIEILEELNKLRQVTAKKLDGGGFETNVAQIFGGAATTNRQALRRQFATILAVDPIAGDVAAQTALEQRMAVTISKVKSIASTHHDELGAMILNAHREGVNSKALGKMISERYGVTLGKGKFIAVNELGNLNAELTELRQGENGVTHYRWRTSLDEVVRPTHAVKEGVIFDWTKPPEDTGHPGQDFRCRCTAEPVLDELEEEEEAQPEPPEPDPFVEPEAVDPTPVIEPPEPEKSPYDKALETWNGNAAFTFPPDWEITEGHMANFFDAAARTPRDMSGPGGLHDRIVTVLLPNGRTSRLMISRVELDLPTGAQVKTFMVETLDRNDIDSVLVIPGLDDAQRAELALKIQSTPGVHPGLRYIFKPEKFSVQWKEFIDSQGSPEWPLTIGDFDIDEFAFPPLWGGDSAGLRTKRALIEWVEQTGGTPADVVAAIQRGERAPKLLRKPNRKFFDAHDEVLDIVEARRQWEKANTGKPFLDKVDDWLVGKKELAALDDAIWELRDEETLLFEALESAKAQGAPQAEKRAALQSYRSKTNEIRRAEERLIELQREVYGPNREKIQEMADELAAFRDELAKEVQNPEQWVSETGAWRSGSTNRITRGGPTWNGVWDETAGMAPASAEPAKLRRSVDIATENMGKWFGDSNAERLQTIRFTKTSDRAYQSSRVNTGGGYINTGRVKTGYGAGEEAALRPTVATQMHEMGHLMEDRNPSLEEGAKRYLLGLAERRPGGIDPTERLSKIYSSNREVYIEGVFYQKYAAKVYKRGGQTHTTRVSSITVDNLHATEVSSMAVQEWNDPNAMLIQYETEPDLFWWAVMMMRGDITQ